MIAPDANLLIYATSPASPFHAGSRKRLEGIMSAAEPVGIPIFSLYGFLRFMTSQALHPRPATFKQAAALVDEWTARSHVRILYPGDRHWSLLHRLATESHIRRAHLNDAAYRSRRPEYGATVHTNDRDFARFPGLLWHNPLASAS